MPRSPSNIDKVIGLRLRERRTDLNICQSALGAAIGVSYQQIQKYERGKSRIAASRLYLVSYQLQMPMDYFFQT